MKKKFGFTLAEVLITLGIIGVVAAMTIPSLMNQTGQAEFKTGFKKAVSVLNQAVTMSFALDGTDFSSLATAGTVTGSIYNMFTSKMSVVNTVAGAITTMGSFTGATNNYTLFFNDGMAITFPSAATSCTTAGQANCRILVDVNGAKSPNRLSQATSGGTTSGIYDQFALNMYNQQVDPRGDAAKYILYN